MSDVFHETEEKKLVFFPLCSINLNEIIPGRNEWVHFVDIWNNGDISESLYGPYRNRDRITFKLKDSKYRYLGDHQAFPNFSKLRLWNDEARKEFGENISEYTNIPTPEVFRKSIRKSRELEREKVDFDYFLYVDQVITYLVNKERYAGNGNLITHKSFPRSFEVKKHEPIKHIGSTPQWEQRDMTPINKSGNPMTFIGQVVGFHYMTNGSDNIYLFLDEETNDVVQIFQFG